MKSHRVLTCLFCLFALGLAERVPAPTHPVVVPRSVAEVTREIVKSQGVPDSGRIMPEFVTDEQWRELGEAVVREHEHENWLYGLPHAELTRATASSPVRWYREAAKEWLRRENATHPVIAAGVAESRVQPVYETKLIGAFPSPCRGETEIRYQLAQPGKAVLAIRDVSGRTVKTLVNGVMNPGVCRAHWDTGHLSAGIYFVSLSAPGYDEMKKLIVMQ